MGMHNLVQVQPDDPIGDRLFARFTKSECGNRAADNQQIWMPNVEGFRHRHGDAERLEGPPLNQQPQVFGSHDSFDRRLLFLQVRFQYTGFPSTDEQGNDPPEYILPHRHAREAGVIALPKPVQRCGRYQPARSCDNVADTDCRSAELSAPICRITRLLLSVANL